MTDFFRFPRTPHLAWLGPGKPRDDKVLATHEVNDLLAEGVIVEEKVDGANLGFSVDESGMLRGQNRGHYLDLATLHGQWKPLKRWLSTREQALVDALGSERMLFGEWCYAVHSVHYTRLPDFFLAFDVYDRARDEFWQTGRRNELVHSLNIATVPELGHGHYDLAQLKKFLGSSQLTDGPAEGIYVRRESNGRLQARAKLVRATFMQAIDEHWTKRQLNVNQLATDHTWR